MIPTLFGGDGKPIRLGQRVGKGGEGEVYTLQDDSNLVLKLYTVQDIQTREPKIRHMVAAKLATKSTVIAFPIGLAFDKAGKFVGFTMTKIAAHEPLHELYAPGARKAAFPNADYRFLIVCAANVCRAIAFAHASGCVVGDINHSGILVSQKARVTLIDADSFQVSEGAKHYLCKVGVPEYTPPELQGKPIGSIVRTANHDAFGLAVVIFQLLFMGRHPFSGSYAHGEMPLEKAIAEHRFAYSRKRSVGMTPPPGVPTLDDFPLAVGAAFEAAFAPDGKNRPTPAQWISLLDELEKSLRVCANSTLHRYPSAASECPWCRMESRFAVPLFIPQLPVFDSTAPVTPTIGDIVAIWRAIEAVNLPPVRPFPHYAGTVVPSEGVRRLRKERNLNRASGALLIVLGIIFAIGFPQLILFSLIFGGLAWWLFTRKFPAAGQSIEDYHRVQTRLFQAESEWKAQDGGREFLELKDMLQQRKNEYDALPTEHKRRVEEYNKNRRTVQLRVHLEQFQIRRFKIPKIGPAKQATLLSYGIETAADVNEAAVLRVPGFGPTNSQPLLNWRRHLEARFVYNPSPTPSDTAALNAIAADVAAKAARIKSDLSIWPGKLTQLSAAMTARQTASVPFIETLLRQRAQAQADIEALGLIPPVVPHPVSPTGPRSGPTVVQAPPSSATVRCPKCNSHMVIRVAKRGARRGHKFYGCARYPACNGTRPLP